MKPIIRGVFGERLKKRREQLGLAQLDVSKIVNIAPSSYSAYETGKQIPKIDVLIRICKRLEVSSDWIIGLVSDTEENT